MSKNQINFARNLRILRDMNEMSQQDLADQIHVARQTVSTWELGGGKPDIYLFCELCELFSIEPTKMLYDFVLDAEFSEKSQTVEAMSNQDFTYKLTTIIDEDLSEIIGLIEYDFTRIMVIALALNRKGYKVIEVFDNGFSVLTKSTDDPDGLYDDLRYIIDRTMHGDDEIIEKETEKISNRIDNVKVDVIDEVMTELIGQSPYSFKYYWVDETETPRGYADSEEQCCQQAKEQRCNRYRIMKRV